MECNKKREVSRFQVTKTGDFLKSPDSCICISLSNLYMVFWYPFTRGKDSLFLVRVFFFLVLKFRKNMYSFIRFLSHMKEKFAKN